MPFRRRGWYSLWIETCHGLLGLLRFVLYCAQGDGRHVPHLFYVIWRSALKLSYCDSAGNYGRVDESIPRYAKVVLRSPTRRL